ncbi:MAG: diaminopimelate decarboxylase [Bacteroidetes bacterium HGW-Bacteroidetes-1]|jgi:diaminopimelate decarboxylase|nr:MAG: diaminopimelate decarboxylase [Bacteroidetes bacterium HGW-Bacteroidetes-1]
MTVKRTYERPVIKKLESNMPNKFGMRTIYEPVTHLEENAVKDLISEYGSPLFVISETKIRKNYSASRQAFETRYPRVQFAWSYKTNYLDAICNIYHQEGSWAEVVSGFEYDKAIRNGVNGSKIIFNGPDKSEEDLRKAVTNNSLIHIDHLDELYLLQDIARATKQRPKVAIRVNMDTGVFPMWDRFGFNYENGQAWDALNKIMFSGQMDLVGLHTHIGTFMLAPSAYAVAASKLAHLAQSVLTKYNHEIKYIDMGGGFASKNTLKGSYLPGSDISPSIDDFAEAITSALMNSDYRPKTPPLLIIESGRVLIDDAAWLLGTVLANKRLSDGRRSVILDVGVNILFTAFWYDHKITPAQAFTSYTEDTALYGPLCMNIDVVRENINMPMLNKGDQLVVHHVGAYNMTQWMQFITLRPKVVLIDEKFKVHVIRNNETLSILTDLEAVPSHLVDFEL